MTLEDIPKNVRTAVAAVGDYLNGKNIGQLDRVSLVQQGIAKYLGCEFELPSAAVRGPLIYFRDQYGVMLDTIVSEFNETYPLDVEMVKSMAYKVWLIRYRMAHNAHDLNWKKFCKVEGTNLVPDYLKRPDVKDAEQHIDVITSSIRKRFY